MAQPPLDWVLFLYFLSLTCPSHPYSVFNLLSAFLLFYHPKSLSNTHCSLSYNLSYFADPSTLSTTEFKLTQPQWNRHSWLDWSVDYWKSLIIQHKQNQDFYPLLSPLQTIFIKLGILLRKFFIYLNIDISEHSVICHLLQTLHVYTALLLPQKAGLYLRGKHKKGVF